jgi:hypothetical protein
MRRSLLALVFLSLMLPAGASADKPKQKQKGPKHKEKKAAQVERKDGFTAEHRELVQVYFVKTYGRGNCPPGLAKKNNGCLPPGQAKKRYTVGQPLAAEIKPDPLPAELSVRIGEPPAGFRYAILDGDLVKLTVGTLLVVDAIEGLTQ